MKYFEYLKSKSWDKKRKSVIKKAGNKCMICYSGGKLNVHHRTYERMFEEKLTDLIALCDRCHKKFHDIIPRYKEPILVNLKLKTNPKQKEFDKINQELGDCKDESRIKELLRKSMQIEKSKTI